MSATLSDVPAPVRVCGAPLHPVSWEQLKDLACLWVKAGGPCRQVVVLNVYSLVVARKDPLFHEAVESSELVACDSVPLSWHSRFINGVPLPRLAGPDLFDAFCALAEERGWGVFFLGSTPEVLDRVTGALERRFPKLRIAGVFSPPMRDVFTEEDNARMVEAVNRAPVDVLWVSLTAPKQEKWIFQNRARLRCKIAAGIGAAFEFAAGTRARAPLWMRKAGLEWLHRLCQEPRRLWWRYAAGNSLFLLLAAQDVAKRFVRRLRAAA